MFKKIVQNNKGVSLIEMIVAVTLFSITILSATQIFKMIVEGQRNAIAAQNVQESMRYAYETMAKEIRMAQKSEDGNEDECRQELGFGTPATYKVFNTVAGSEGDILYFKNRYDECVAYYLTDGSLMVYRGGDEASITPSQVKVNNLLFYIVDDVIGGFHSTQPLVTMTMDVTVEDKEMHKQSMKMQTIIESRYYE